MRGILNKVIPMNIEAIVTQYIKYSIIRLLHYSRNETEYNEIANVGLSENNAEIYDKFISVKCKASAEGEKL
jgi:predicted Zn-ribbon and HTH transcriptional regulator